MARPVCKGFCRDRRLISLLQRIRPRRSPPGQDGDTRAPVLINSSASCAVFNTRLPERRLTVRPSPRHLSQPPLARPALSLRPNESLRGHGYRVGVKRFPALQHRPGDPRQLVGQGDDRDIAMGPPHQLFRPSAERRVTLRDMGQRGARPVDQLFAQILVAALADSEQLRLTPVVNCLGTKPSHAARSRPWLKVSARPTAATTAEATIAPIPGIVVNRRASSFSFAQRTNSASKAAIRRSGSAHCARASSMSRIVRGLKLAPPCSSISTFRNCLSFHLPCGDQPSLQ